MSGGLKSWTQFWKGTTQETFQQNLVEIGTFVNVIAVKMASKRQHEYETYIEEDDCNRTAVTTKKKKWLTKLKGCYSSEFQCLTKSTISYQRH
jgi:hypothetical protein